MFYGYLYVVTSLLIGLSTGCSFNVTKTSGNLTSPNYPTRYSTNLDCDYVIRSPTKQPITLVFEDFEVEDNSFCKHDYVTVEDGGDLTLLGKFCGEKIPPPLLALSGVVIVKFHSDQNVIRKGFLTVFNDSQDCVYVKKDGYGSIRSPNFPATYPQDILCFYYIESVNKIPINITFTSFDLEHTSSGTCDKDYIRVLDGISKSAKLLGTFCGKQIPFLPVVYSGSVFLILRSNNLISGQGFSAEYKEEAFLDCSGYLNAVSGRIQSPNYPENYNRKTDCEYRIVSPYNESSINLTFLHFELEKQEDCDYDFVEIYDLNQRIGRFCGTQNPVLTFTLSSSIRVVFHSDSGGNFKGFYATFTQITDYQTTEELPSTLSFSTMSNTTFKPSLSSASDNTVVIGVATGVIIGIAVAFIILYVIIGRQRRTEKNQLGRKCSEKQPFDTSEHDHYSMENIDHDSTANSDGHRVANDKSCFGTEIHVYANDTEMIKDVIVNDDVNNEYSYSNLLTTDTSNNKHLADNSYYDISENYNEVNKNLKTCESEQFERETNSSEYIDNEEAYNILNINPQKINDTEKFDRTTNDVYDKTTHITNTSYSELCLYDHSANN